MNYWYQKILSWWSVFKGKKSSSWEKSKSFLLFNTVKRKDRGQKSLCVCSYGATSLLQKLKQKVCDESKNSLLNIWLLSDVVLCVQLKSLISLEILKKVQPLIKAYIYLCEEQLSPIDLARSRQTVWWTELLKLEWWVFWPLCGFVALGMERDFHPDPGTWKITDWGKKRANSKCFMALLTTFMKTEQTDSFHKMHMRGEWQGNFSIFFPLYSQLLVKNISVLSGDKCLMNSAPEGVSGLPDSLNTPYYRFSAEILQGVTLTTWYMNSLVCLYAFHCLVLFWEIWHSATTGTAQCSFPFEHVGWFGTPASQHGQPWLSVLQASEVDVIKQFLQAGCLRLVQLEFPCDEGRELAQISSRFPWEAEIFSHCKILKVL